MDSCTNVRGGNNRWNRSQLGANLDFNSRPDFFICSTGNRYLRNFSRSFSLDFAGFTNFYPHTSERFFAIYQIKLAESFRVRESFRVGKHKLSATFCDYL